MAQFSKKGYKRFQQKELANIANNPLLGFSPTYGSQTYKLTPQDSLLVEKGGTSLRALDVYHDLCTDPHVFGCLEKLTQEIISRDFVVSPYDDSEQSKEVANWVEGMLMNLGSRAEEDDESEPIQKAVTYSSGIDSLTKSLAFALITGFQPAEVIWAIDSEGLIYPKFVSPKDARRFSFEADGEGNIYPKLLLNNSSYDGMYLPKKKFIFHTIWSLNTDDPYGMGLGRQIYYPVQWKREAFTYWLTVLDKYTDPIAVGKAPDYSTDEQLEDFKSFLVGISRETSIVLPEGFNIEFVSHNLTGVKEVLTELITICDKHISLSILGEAVTGEQVGSSLGSTRESVGNSIRIMKAKALSDGISDTLNNTLIKWAVEYRFGKDTPCPKFYRVFEDKKDISEIIGHFETLKRMEFPVDFSQLSELTGYKMAEKPTVDSILSKLPVKQPTVPEV